jgi:uncharacterized phage-associated protein
MYNIYDLCTYIIYYSNTQSYDISNLKLQKLLYFLQAHYLVTQYQPLFTTPIEAWSVGPIIPSVYKKYAAYGSGNIPIDTTTEPLLLPELSAPDKQTISEIVDHFADYTATDLVYITQNQAPWKRSYNPTKHNVIPLKVIYKYFAEAQEIFTEVL